MEGAPGPAGAAGSGWGPQGGRGLRAAGGGLSQVGRSGRSAGVFPAAL